jgi:hypothetical protein
MKTLGEFKVERDKLCIEYIRKMHGLLMECREQGVSTEECTARIDALKDEFNDKYQRLVLNMYKRKHLKL